MGWKDGKITNHTIRSKEPTNVQIRIMIKGQQLSFNEQVAARMRDVSGFAGEKHSEGVVFFPTVADGRAVEKGIGFVVVDKPLGGGIEVE